MNKLNIMIVGVGGQGTLLTGRVLGKVAVKSGYDVKVSEVHGMSQRGGSVVTYVKMGEKVFSPMVEKGEADVVMAFEKLEALLKDFADFKGQTICKVPEIGSVTIGVPP